MTKKTAYFALVSVFVFGLTLPGAVEAQSYPGSYYGGYGYGNYYDSYNSYGSGYSNTYPYSSYGNNYYGTGYGYGAGAGTYPYYSGQGYGGQGNYGTDQNTQTYIDQLRNQVTQLLAQANTLSGTTGTVLGATTFNPLLYGTTYYPGQYYNNYGSNYGSGTSYNPYGYGYVNQGYSFGNYNNSGPNGEFVDIRASREFINSGSSLTLSWDTRNVRDCRATGDWSGLKGVRGSQSISPTNDSSYTLRCSGIGPNSFTLEDTVDISVDGGSSSSRVEISRFTANPTSVQLGSRTTLSWEVKNADRCRASGGSGGWSGSVARRSGTFTTDPLTTTSTFVLTCDNDDYTESQSVTVGVFAS